MGLRLSIGAQTIVVPNVYDPSELRSDVNGKVVRYLHVEGAEIAKGDSYIELEAMKMIMALKSPETGQISHALSPGSIVSAGELLATLELKDPSKAGGPSLSKPAELQGKTDLWSLSIPQSLKDGMSGALESVKDGMESAHKGVTDQVWQSQHTEMMEKFNKYDVDGDGHICSGELVTWVFGPKNEDDSEVQKSVKCFVEKFGPKSGKLSPQDMYYVFAPIIKSTDGYLSNVGC
ncbi:unnamed protein product [Effrenium voratum]|nr:unnamed protein product [Effrenium voratum]